MSSTGVAEPPTLDMDIREKMMVKVGDSCTLSGRYSGTPAPTVAWTKNDEELKADEEISLHSTGRHLSLTVNKAKREHSGRYSVTVENAAGSRTGVCNITVVGMCPCSHPQYTSGPDYKYEVKFKCDALFSVLVVSNQNNCAALSIISFHYF